MIREKIVSLIFVSLTSHPEIRNKLNVMANETGINLRQ
jgi:hypothetical protein